MLDVDSFLGKLKTKHDDDVVDRMNYLYTSWMLIIAALLVLAKQYVGESLQCWVPKHFMKPWEQYIESYCFVENTYFLPVDNMTKTSIDRRKELQLQYYQWVPFFLLGMVFAFNLPRKIWRTLNWRSGLSITEIVEAARIIKKVKKGTCLTEEAVNEEEKAERKHCEARMRLPGHIAGSILANIQKGRSIDHGFLGFWRQRLATSYVTNCYLLYKAMNLANSLLQLYALNVFLGHHYTFWGFGVLNDLLNGRQWHASGHFPRITFCDVEQMVNFGRNLHTVQCVLMLNLFNEKIFIFFWFWLLILSMFNLANLLYWSISSFTPFFVNGIIKQHLAYMQIYCDENYPIDKRYRTYREEDLTKFIRKYLRADGLTVIRLISDNCGDAVAAEIVGELWFLSQMKTSDRFYKKSVVQQAERAEKKGKRALRPHDQMVIINPGFDENCEEHAF